MRVKLSSQGREIISHGTVFLFDENADFTLNIVGENSFEVILAVHFVEDALQKQHIESDPSGNRIDLTCINFSAEGTGLSVPVEIAVIDRKKIYFMFWAYLEGNDKTKPRARKVEYTLFRE